MRSPLLQRSRPPARPAGAAKGETNQEIADELFLSRRTVESHVASTLRELSLPSRKALRGPAGAAARPGPAHVSRRCRPEPWPTARAPPGWG
ncbi:response regulator transcription factor [Nonomuraea sp. LPB2021202275-12-8]|uniref:response regulator transcription factor n=1 Tax=Nonomuraea sp. LPB2021202275-12-8 TaxID=3120159 RepID=UPI00300C29F5